jgi:hypothetical protein
VADLAVTNGICAVSGAGGQPLWRIVFAAIDTVERGAPIRLTRQSRVSFYRAGDGTWQLGISDWSDALHAFASPQPVAGPLALTTPAGARSGFRYFDAGGSELPVGLHGVNVANVVRVRISVIAPVRNSAGRIESYRSDSLDVAMRHEP